MPVPRPMLSRYFWGEVPPGETRCFAVQHALAETAGDALQGAALSFSYLFFSGGAGEFPVTGTNIMVLVPLGLALAALGGALLALAGKSRGCRLRRILEAVTAFLFACGQIPGRPGRLLSFFLKNKLSGNILLIFARAYTIMMPRATFRSRKGRPEKTTGREKK